MIYKIFAANIKQNITVEQYNKWLDLIALENKHRIHKFSQYEDALRTLLGEILIRYLLNKHFQIANEKLVFVKNEYGKPYLRDFQDIHFNIAHSRDWVVGVLNSVPVGIDIEYMRDIDFALAQRFFTDNEYKYLIKKPLKLQVNCFYELWTAKESYIKALGKGLSMPLNSFNVINKESQDILQIDNFYIKYYKLDPKYKLAVCATTMQVEEIEFISTQDIYF